MTTPPPANQPGQPPHGQPAYGQQPYAQQAYGQPYGGAGWGGPPPPTRSNKPWLITGLVVVAVAAITVSLVLVLRGGDDHDKNKKQNSATSPTGSPRSAVQTYLDADRTHDVKKASTVVCPAKRNELTDPNADLGLDDPQGMAQVKFTIDNITTSGDNATAAVTAALPGYPSKHGTFSLQKQQAGWFVCGAQDSTTQPTNLPSTQPTGQPSGGPPQQLPTYDPSNRPTNVPPTQATEPPSAPTSLPPGRKLIDGAASPQIAAVGWLTAKKKSDWLGAIRWVCPENKQRTSQDHSFSLFVNSGEPIPSLTWQILGTTYSGNQAVISVRLSAKGKTENATFQAEFAVDQGAWYVCELNE